MEFAAADTSKTTMNDSRNNAYYDSDDDGRCAIGSPINTLGTPSRRPRTVKGNTGTFQVWPMTQDNRRCNDEVHFSVNIPPAMHIVLDTPQVQRLGNLKQLGCAFNTYPSCTHTRKEHSMGVAELAARLAQNIQTKQPQLGVTDMDILCVRIAGLCHDLGHGPFSHAYEAFLKAAWKHERDNPDMYEERNAKFKEACGLDMPSLDEHWAHEGASLMMIDELLASRGLEINWDDKDGPLTQIGKGTDATKFGWIVKGPDDIESFTSRDWIFIKECINGSPLTFPDAPIDQTDFVGRTQEKEFLYDIVNNRHNGLDVDKIDYYARDYLAAKGMKNLDILMLEEAVVAWGHCPNHKKCFKCKSKSEPDKHLMMCYPDKFVANAMHFYAQRMKNHREVYGHKKSKSAELKMIDLLLEANKHYCMMMSTQLKDPLRIPTASRFLDFKFPRLPISRAWMYPKLYLRVDDGIVGIVEDRATDNDDLLRLKELIYQCRNHVFYKCAGEKEVVDLGGDAFWNDTSEDDIRREILEGNLHYDAGGKALTLDPNDIHVEKREIHCGRKKDNPVGQMRFLYKSQCGENLKNTINELPIAREVTKFPSDTPKEFVERTIRVFSRSEEKNEFVAHAYENWFAHKQEILAAPNCEFKIFGEQNFEEEDDSQPASQPACLTQDSAMMHSPAAPMAGRKRKDEPTPSPTRARRKIF